MITVCAQINIQSILVFFDQLAIRIDQLKFATASDYGFSFPLSHWFLNHNDNCKVPQVLDKINKL